MDPDIRCRRPHSRRPGTWLLLAGLLAGLLLGCSGSTEPGGGEAEISFKPAVTSIRLLVSETADFSVTATTDDLAVDWIRRNVVVAQTPNYRYVPDRVGVDTLRAAASAGGIERTKVWQVLVDADPEDLPPEVIGVILDDGPLPEEVIVGWSRVTPTGQSIADYVIKVSDTVPVTTANWDECRLLGEIEHLPTTIDYRRTFNAADDGLVPGARAFYGIRSRDVLGQLSPLTTIHSHILSTAWWIAGTVRDDQLTIPAPFPVSFGALGSTNTKEDGTYQFGPFRSVDSCTLRTRTENLQGSGWFDYRSPPLSGSDGETTPVDVTLIRRYPLDSACADFDGYFLTYLRYMTASDVNALPLTRLYTWDAFPVPVYVQPHVNANEIDLGQLGVEALDLWNTALGVPTFSVTADSLSAGIVVNFTDMNSQNGIALLEDPGGVIGDAVPVRMRVLIEVDFANAQYAQEVLLHELGHTLGVARHATCSGAGYLMYTDAGGSLDDGEFLHEDELRLYRAIRNLPQGVDLMNYYLGLVP